MIKFLLAAIIALSMVTACGQRNDEPAPTPDVTDNGNMADDMKNAVGDVENGVGDAVKGAGDAVKDTGDAMKDMGNSKK